MLVVLDLEKKEKTSRGLLTFLLSTVVETLKGLKLKALTQMFVLALMAHPFNVPSKRFTTVLKMSTTTKSWPPFFGQIKVIPS